MEDKNELFLKYNYLVKVIIKKYYQAAQALNIDMGELEGEANLAFSDALTRYDEAKNAKLSTFLSLCIERRIIKVLKKYSTEKSKINTNTFSLDYDYNEDVSLKDLISDDYEFEPLNNLTEEEAYTELITKIKEKLSNQENELFNYLINDFDNKTIMLLTNLTYKQIDNAKERIKHKIKEIIKEN